MQGRTNDIMLLLCSYAKDTEEAAALVVVIQRQMSALPYILYSGRLLGGDRSFLEHTSSILLKDEYARLLQVSDSDKSFAIMEWILIAFLNGIERDLFNGGESVAFFVTSQIQQLRGTYGSLVDSLEDAVLPFPFVNLMLLNILIVAAVLPVVFFPVLSKLLQQNMAAQRSL